jgi:hypothetical protein
VLAGDHELGLGELLRSLDALPGDAGERRLVAGAAGAQQVVGPIAELLQARSDGEGRGHDSLLPGSVVR